MEPFLGATIRDLSDDQFSFQSTTTAMTEFNLASYAGVTGCFEEAKECHRELFRILFRCALALDKDIR